MAYPRSIISQAGESSSSIRLSDHQMTLTGTVINGPKDTIGRRTELQLTPDDIRRTVLSWAATHPDEFGPSLRAIVAEWDKIDEENTSLALAGRRTLPVDSHDGYQVHANRLWIAAATKEE